MTPPRPVRQNGRPPGDVSAETGQTLNAVILAKSRVLKRIRAKLRGLVI